MSVGMVRKWVRMFNEGRKNVHDEARSGRRSLVNADLVRKVNERVRDDRRFTISDLSLHFPQISRTLLYDIVSSHSGRRRPHSMRRIYKNLCPATISASIMATNMWKNSLKNVESDKNNNYYETLVDFFYSETVLTFWISLVHNFHRYSNELYDSLDETKNCLIYEKETAANGRTCPTDGWNGNFKETSEGPGKGQKKVARQSTKWL